jgi:hypothetical protein
LFARLASRYEPFRLVRLGMTTSDSSRSFGGTDMPGRF